MSRERREDILASAVFLPYKRVLREVGDIYERCGWLRIYFRDRHSGGERYFSTTVRFL